MRRHIGLISIIGLFASLAAADAQTPPPSTAGAVFDGTYRLVSSARVNQTFMTRKAQVGQCPDRRPGPLTVMHGQVRYKSATGYPLRGTVGPQGELAMRAVAPSSWASQPIDLSVSGTVDGAGTAHVRQLGHSCSYDFVWQKASR